MPVDRPVTLIPAPLTVEWLYERIFPTVPETLPIPTEPEEGCATEEKKLVNSWEYADSVVIVTPLLFVPVTHTNVGRTVDMEDDEEDDAGEEDVVSAATNDAKKNVKR